MSNAPLADRLKNAEMRKQIAELELKTTIAEKRLKVVNEWDVLKSSNSKLRRQPSPEYGSEDDQLSTFKRGQAVAFGRDLQRNFSGVAAALNQFMLNAVGAGPKLRLHSARGDFVKQAASWFNGTWAKECDFRDDANFGEMIGLLEVALKREGDSLLVFDDFGLIPGEGASGKCLWYEADQFVELDKLPVRYENAKQHRGVIYDRYGRRLAYSVSADYGKMSVPLEEATIFPAAVARHIKRTWRFNQLRGTPALLSIAADCQDLYELQSKEIQTGKTLSSQAGVVKRSDNADAQDAGAEGGTTTTGATYKRLESLMGGAIEYLDPEDDFVPLDWHRPALNFVESIDQLMRKAFSALGLSQTYSLLKVTSSYTAFRGEMLLAWSQFYFDQKFLERHACDWTAGKALAWKYGTLPEDLTMSWDWPKMQAVDPLKDAAATELLIKTLQTNYSEQLGPEWQSKMEQLAKETKEAQRLGLPTVWEAEKQGDGLGGMSTTTGKSKDTETDAKGKDADDEED